MQKRIEEYKYPPSNKGRNFFTLYTLYTPPPHPYSHKASEGVKKMKGVNHFCRT